MRKYRQKRVVFTGGPSGGKTTIIDMALRRFGRKVAVVPEAATILYAGGFPRRPEPEAVRHIQRAIYYTTRELEDFAAAMDDAAIALCDRGTLDCLAYWPETGPGLLETVGSDLKSEFARYDIALHLRPPKTAAGYQTSATRIEPHSRALELDRKIEAVWKNHPNRHVIEETPDFLMKANKIMELLDKAVRNLA
ncbi:MAG: AAA family ATPase [Elusimicrobiales bacterium]